MFEVHEYSASLLQIDQANYLANVTISDNIIDDCVTYGGNMSLFDIEGATLTAERNKFTRIGKLSGEKSNFTKFITYENATDFITKGADNEYYTDDDVFNYASYFPVDMAQWSSKSWFSAKGIF